MGKRLLRIIRGFAITIVIVLAFGWLFGQYTDTLSEEQQEEVLIMAIPFVAVFVSIILAFIGLIMVVAVAFEGKVPQRTYRPVEGIIIGGILLGVVGLFQGWKLFAYETGFLVLLVSLLGFMLWSHLSPMSPRQSRKMPPLSRQAHGIGVIAGLVVWAVVAAVTISDAEPKAPYGMGKTLWEFQDEDEKAAIKDEAESEYRNAKIPVLALVSLLPAAIVYLMTREIVAALRSDVSKEKQTSDQVPVSATPG